VVVDLALLGLGIALQPFRLSAFILILSTKGGTRKGLGFILGWLACLVLVIAVVVLITGGRPVRFHTLPGTVVQIAKLALGIALIRGPGRPRRRRSARRWFQGQNSWYEPMTVMFSTVGGSAYQPLRFSSISAYSGYGSSGCS
jgi:Sap, sulfolipid-1-addressing protein